MWSWYFNDIFFIQLDTLLVDSIHLGIDGNIFTSNEQKPHRFYHKFGW